MHVALLRPSHAPDQAGYSFHLFYNTVNLNLKITTVQNYGNQWSAVLFIEVENGPRSAMSATVQAGQERHMTCGTV